MFKGSKLTVEVYNIFRKCLAHGTLLKISIEKFAYLRGIDTDNCNWTRSNPKTSETKTIDNRQPPPPPPLHYSWR